MNANMSGLEGISFLGACGCCAPSPRQLSHNYSKVFRFIPTMDCNVNSIKLLTAVAGPSTTPWGAGAWSWVVKLKIGTSFRRPRWLQLHQLVPGYAKFHRSHVKLPANFPQLDLAVSQLERCVNNWFAFCKLLCKHLTKKSTVRTGPP